MHNLAGFGRLFGGLGIALGALLIAMGLFVREEPADRIARERCEVERSMGRRAAPCPLPGGVDRPLLLAAGGSAIASGTLFLLLSGILATLAGLREDLQNAEQRRQAEARRAPDQPPEGFTRPDNPAPAPRRAPPTDRIGDPPANPIPSRFELLTRHGEAVGGAAWEIMRQAQKNGFAVPESDAVAEARRRG